MDSARAIENVFRPSGLTDGLKKLNGESEKQSSSSCPRCGSSDKNVCNGGNKKYPRPHPHGKWGRTCCADIWHKAVPTGDWIQTFSGGKFYPLDPRPEQVKIEDIAHALSNLCRFTGHVREFYSVAQHCVLVSHFCDPQFALWGLLHDAPEAYICDLARPVKYHPELAAYKVVEKRLEEAVVEHFNLSPKTEPVNIKMTDRRLLFTERRDLLPELPWDSDGWGMGLEGKTFPYKIVPWPPKYAEEMFLLRFKELTDGNSNTTTIN